MRVGLSSVLILLTVLLGLGFGEAEAAPFPKDSRYFPHYSHTTVSGIPSVTTSGHTMIYFRQGNNIYRLVPLRNGGYWAGKAWSSLAASIIENHADAVIDLPQGADPVTLILNGKEVSFKASDLLDDTHRGHIDPVSAHASHGTPVSVEHTAQNTGIRTGNGYDNTSAISLCQLTGRCGGGSGSSGTSSGAASSSSSDSSSSPGSTGPVPPAPAACASATAAATVTPGTFKAALASLGAGKKIILAPGTYPAMRLSGKNFGGATIQCAQPGACKFGSENEVSNISGLTVDGIATRGGNTGFVITASQNVTIRCSSFTEQTNTGVLILPGQSTNQISIEKNVFFNQTTGCQYNNSGNCSGQLSDGSPVANMDYGVRIHAGRNIYVRDNIFGVLFNHSISLKEDTDSVFITGNTFNKCGRNCIEPGQQASNVKQGDISCGTVTITGNTFNDVRTPMVLVKNIHRVIYNDNIYNNSPGKRFTLHNFKTDPRGYGLLTNSSIINGVPRDRAVVGNGGGS